MGLQPQETLLVAAEELIVGKRATESDLRPCRTGSASRPGPLVIVIAEITYFEALSPCVGGRKVTRFLVFLL